MIRRIQARNFCCLRYVDISLDRFHVLVGPNASGKSTLLDVVAFLGDMVSGGLEAAVEKRTRNFQDLVWRRPATQLGFELAVEFDIPEDVKAQLPRDKDFELFRYEVAITEGGDGIRIDSERGLLMPPRRRLPSPGGSEVPRATRWPRVHPARRRAARFTHDPEQVPGRARQLQRRGLGTSGEGMDDQHLVRPGAVDAGKPPGVS